jgi:hypothetical protein
MPFSSKSTRGLYHEDHHGARSVLINGEMVPNPLIPADAVELTEDQYQGLIGQTLDWSGSGAPVVAAISAATLAAQAEALLSAAIQAHIDAPAKAWGYDDARSAVSYVGDPFPAFNAEGVAIQTFRSECWAMAREVQQEVLAGERAMPTVAEMLALLPQAPERPTV